MEDPWDLLAIPTLRGERVVLRKPRPQDIEARRRLGGVAEENRMYGGTLAEDVPWDTSQAERWYTQRIPGQQYRWTIEVEGRCVGSCGIYPGEKHLRFGIGISDRTMWNRGLGTETARLVLAFSFHELGEPAVELAVLEFNKRAIRSFEKAGFKFRAIDAQELHIGDEIFHDWIYEATAPARAPV